MFLRFILSFFRYLFQTNSVHIIFSEFLGNHCLQPDDCVPYYRSYLEKCRNGRVHDRLTLSIFQIWFQLFVHIRRPRSRKKYLTF